MASSEMAVSFFYANLPKFKSDYMEIATWIVKNF